MAVDGEVVYEIRADDSKLDSDLDEAQKKVEKSSEKSGEKVEQIEKETSKTVKQEKESVTKHHKEQNEERSKDDEETGKKREETERNTGEKIKAIAGSTAKAIGAGMLAAGTAAVTVGGMAVKGATDLDQAMNQFIASTGKGTEETERYQKVLESVYANNYGDSFEDIAQSMSEVVKQMGDMDDAALQDVTESAYALRDTFEYEIPESTRAAKAMMDNFGTSGEEAMSLIAAGAQNGLDYSGELLDSISEYSVQFAKVGLDADDMFKIFQKGAETGAWNLDKIGDAVKEMSIRVIDGSETTKEGFESIGMNADEMSAKFAAGGDSAKEAFKQTIEALAGMKDPLAQNTAGVNLFGTMWEDLGPEVVTQLASIEDGAYDTADAMDQIKEVKYDDLGSMLEGLKRSLELLLIPLGEQLIPIMTELIESVLPVIQELLPPLMDSIGEMIAQLSPVIDALLPGLMECINGLLPPLLDIINAILPLLVEILKDILPELGKPIEALSPLIQLLLEILIPVLQMTLSVFQEVFSGIIDAVTRSVQNVTAVLNNLMAFIKNVFTGNWRGAWENIKNIFKAVANSLGMIFKIPINTIIDMINGFLKGLNKIQIPDWVPGIGGKGFHIDMIPRLKKGMDFVPGDYFPAYLDYGERVLTQEENMRFTALGGIGGMEKALSKGMGAAGNRCIIIKVPVEIDGREVARSTAEYMGEQQYWEDL